MAKLRAAAEFIDKFCRSRYAGVGFWLGIISLVCVSFFPIFLASYVSWDDNVLVTGNQILKLPFGEALRVVFTSTYHGDFIPLTLLFYWLEVNLFGFDPNLQHSINLVFHLANVVLVAGILRALGVGTIVFVFSVLAFAIHPLQVESVAWISERKGLCASFFALSCILAFIRYRNTNRHSYLFFSSCSYFLSLGFKASAIFAPILLFAIDLSLFRTPWRRALFVQLPALFGAIVFSIVRTLAYGSGVSGFSEFFFLPERWLYLPLKALHAIGFYLSKFIAPVSLSPVYEDFALTPWDGVLILLALLSIILAITILLKRRSGTIAIAIIWVSIFLLPVLHIIPRINHVNDRYMYLPIVGVALFATSLVRKVVPLLVVIGAIWWPLQSHRQSSIWMDSLSLWSAAARVYPKSGLVMNNLGLELQNRGRYRETIEIYEAGLKEAENPSIELLMTHNLGVVYFTEGHPDFDLNKAAEYFRKAIAIAPTVADQFDSRFNLALVYLEMGRADAAVSELEILLRDIEGADAKYLGLKEKVQALLIKLK